MLELLAQEREKSQLYFSSPPLYIHSSDIPISSSLLTSLFLFSALSLVVYSQNTNMGLAIPLSFSILLFLIVSSRSIALTDCDFPAIFNLGDSNSDTGGLSASIIQAPWPHGISYFHMPAGRYSDGRLIIDFMGMFSIML